MPPITFIEVAIGTYSDATKLVTVATPQRARRHDVLIAVVATPDSRTYVASDDWEILARLAAASTEIVFLRRAAEDDEPASHAFEVSATGDDADAMILLYRGISAGAAPVASGITGVAAPSTSFSAPSVTLAAYSDMMIAAYFANASTGFTAAAGMTEIADGGDADGGRLMVSDVLPEAAGATGAKVATSGSSSTGASASIALAANPLPTPDGLVLDPPGAIGLPIVGV